MNIALKEKEAVQVGEIKVKVSKLDLFYGSFQALKDINMDIGENHVTALIGPSGCGKSTFLSVSTG